MVGSEVEADGVRIAARLRVKSADPTRKDVCMMELLSTIVSLNDERPRVGGE